MDSIRLVHFTPDGGNRAGQRFRQGALTITVTSKVTMRHVTLRFRCRRKSPSGKWVTVPYVDASHVFIEDYGYESIATLSRSVLRFAPMATEAARWSVIAVLRYVNGDYSLERTAEMTPEDVCIRCGRPLTDPESIERGYGPECYGLRTGSVSVRGSGE